MAFKKPVINTIKPDIKNVSIYLRSVKKFGKSTLFRDVILEKYGDPARGLLVEIGMVLNVQKWSEWKREEDIRLQNLR